MLFLVRSYVLVVILYQWKEQDQRKEHVVEDIEETVSAQTLVYAAASGVGAGVLLATVKEQAHVEEVIEETVSVQTPVYAVVSGGGA